MADELQNPPGAPATPPVAVINPPPVVPTPAPEDQVRVTVPASALFDEEELKPLPMGGATGVAGDPKPEDATPAPVVPAAKPDETPAPKPEDATPAPVAEKKFTIDGKEYTEAELKAKLAEKAAPPAPAAPAAAPAPEAKPPTPEEVAAQEKSWRDGFLKHEKLNVGFSTEEMEAVLTGGEEGAKVLSDKLKEITATAVLLARKSVYSDLNPTLADINSKLSPVYQNQQQVEAAAAEHQFFTAYPDFKDVADKVRQVGQALLQQYPKEMAALTREQQLAEVAAQADRLLQGEYKQWNPNATGTWRDAKKTVPAAAPVIPAAQPAAAAPAKTPPAKPAVPAPGANSPAANPAGGASPSFAKDTAKSLQD